jgi:hypothetical protein
MKFRFTEEAWQELIDAGVYYAEQNRLLVDDLELEVKRALNFLSEFPGAAKQVDAIHRTYKLKRFPIFWSIALRAKCSSSPPWLMPPGGQATGAGGIATDLGASHAAAAYAASPHRKQH